MLCFQLFILAVLPLFTTQSTGEGEKTNILSADCNEPKKFPKDKLGTFVAELNRRRRLMVDGNQQNGGTGEKLKKGESVMEMEWSCDLEEKAIAALNTTECPTQCTTYPPNDKDGPSEIPSGTTGFFDCQDYTNGYEPMGNWLSEIDKVDIYQDPNPDVRVMYGSKNRNYCNLVRYDAYRIGCAEKDCDKTRLTFCLTNQPPLQEKDVVYYTGDGACPKGMCYSTTGGCNRETGLCLQPQPIRTPTPSNKKSKSVICHFSFLLSSCVEV